jgi:SAM-dependent methyltransferase
VISPTATHRKNSRCRLCGASQLHQVLQLEPSPIADAYVTAAQLDDPQPRFPMDLYQCEGCGHVQLLDVISAETLFRDYIYRTSDSEGLVEHFRRYVDELAARFAPAPGRLAVDIGSNDGTVLRFWRDHGQRVCGVDPAVEIAREATERGLPTRCGYFDIAAARSLRADFGAATIVTANNVFAHADNLPEILDGVRELLDDTGVFVFEVSYLVDIIERKLFDTIYHEHLCYHSIGPLVKFFAAHGMELFDVERIPTKGGSIRVFAQRAGGPQCVEAIVDELLRLEQIQALDSGLPFRSLAVVLERNKIALRRELELVRARGRRVAGFGASATVTTLISHFELAPLLDFLVDDNPKRDGLFSPHYHIPVCLSQILYEEPPACVVILAWQYVNPITRKHQAYARDGRFFLLPMPDVTRIG